MTHYYAYCESHGKCGENRDTPNQAATDCNKHVETVSGPHGLVYVKLSNITVVGGVRKYSYMHLKNLGVQGQSENELPLDNDL